MNLQKLHEELGGKGLVVVGFNSADDVAKAQALLTEKGATYRNVLDPSAAGRNVFFREFKGSGVPLHYVIDRDGKVAEAWYGQRSDDRRVRALLERLGVR